MSETCMTCGGLIMAPGQVYGYSGPTCHCIVPPRIQQPAPPEAAGYHSRSEMRRLQAQGEGPTSEMLTSTKISTCFKCMRDTATRDGDCTECGLSKQSDLESDQNSASSSVARNDSDVDQKAKAREWIEVSAHYEAIRRITSAANAERDALKAKVKRMQAALERADRALEFYASGQHAISEFNDGGRARVARAELGAILKGE